MLFVNEFDIRNFRELGYFLFRRKTCPRCSGKVYRIDTLPQHSMSWERDGNHWEYAYKVKNAVRYRCDPCHAYFSLQELAARA